MLTDADRSTVNPHFSPESIHFHHKCNVVTKIHDAVKKSMREILSSFIMLRSTKRGLSVCAAHLGHQFEMET